MDNKNKKIYELEDILSQLTEEKSRTTDINKKQTEYNIILSKDISNKTNDIENTKTNIHKLGQKKANYTITHKTILEDLIKKIADISSYIQITRKEADILKRNHKEYIEQVEFELSANFDAEKTKFENEIEDTKKKNEDTKDKTKQLLHYVENRTLECDILSRKIKIVGELQLSRKIELKPLVPMHNFREKRQIDETSDSSVDETIPFHRRMLMKRNKKGTISERRMNQF